jgi:hypothetical protein
VSGLDKVRHAVATHPVATVGLVLGTVAMAIPGAEGVGAELDESSIAAMSTGTDLSPVSIAQTVKTIAGGGAAMADIYGCGRGDLTACGGALLSGGSVLTPGDTVDEFVGWLITTTKYAIGH